jgi:hypothetical protein
MPKAIAGMGAQLPKNRNRLAKLFAPQIGGFVIH